MATVKCRYCGEPLDKEEAICIQHGKQYWYYHDGHQYALTKWQERREVLRQILGPAYENPILSKEMNVHISKYGEQKVYSFLKHFKDRLIKNMTKDFDNDFGKVRYFSAILRNNLPNYHFNEDIVFDKDCEDLENEDSGKFKRKKRTSLTDVMGGL